MAYTLKLRKTWVWRSLG